MALNARKYRKKEMASVNLLVFDASVCLAVTVVHHLSVRDFRVELVYDDVRFRCAGRILCNIYINFYYIHSFTRQAAF